MRVPDLRLLFFAPFSEILEHATVEARVAAALQSRGHEVTYVSCGGVLNDLCVPMYSQRLSRSSGVEDRQRVCASCRAKDDALRRSFGLQGPRLSELISDSTLADATVAARRIASSNDMFEAVEAGVPVSRRALYPFLISRKRTDLDFSEDERDEYSGQILQSLIAVQAAGELVKTARPDAVLTYTSLYGVLASFAQFVQNNGVSAYFFEASSNFAHRLENAVFARGDIYEHYRSLRKQWAQWQNRPAAPAAISTVADHLINLFGQRTVFSYSPAVNHSFSSARDHFKVPKSAKLLLATMSSYDELFASYEAGYRQRGGGVFDSQAEWLRWLLDYVGAREDLFLIVRVHPREFPNQRTKSHSQHVEQLRVLFKDIPRNCVINWPDDEISLYDLAKEIDVVCNAWSSAGKELGMLGIPVVQWASHILIYPPRPEYTADSPADYGAKIERALREGWSEQEIRRMYRWCAMEFGSSTFRVGDRVPRSRLANLASRAIRKIGRKLFGANFDIYQAARRRIPPADVDRIEKALKEGTRALAPPYDQGDEAAHRREEAALVEATRRVTETLFGVRSDSKLKQELLRYTAHI